MKKTRILAMILCLCMTLALVACGGGNNKPANDKPANSAPATEEKKEETKEPAPVVDTNAKLSGDLEVGILKAEGTTAYDVIVKYGGEALRAENPDLNITYTFANTKARSFMDQRWRSNDAPDTDYFVYNAQIPSTHEFTEYLLDLTPYLAEDGWGDSFIASAQAVTNLNGATYGVVTDTHILGLYYNKDYFDQYGINPPATWDELVAACETLKSNGIDPIAVTGTYAPYMGSWLDHLMMREVGYDVANDAIRSATMSENAGIRRAVEKVKVLIDNDYLLNGFEGTDFTAVQMQFFQGQAGMILMGTWLTSEMADSIPEDFNLGFCAFPVVDGGEGDPGETLSHSNIMSINKDSENLEAALAYLKQLTSVECQTAFVEQAGFVSAVKGVPAPAGVYGLTETIEAAETLRVRHYAMELEADRNTAYYNEVAKLFMGEYKTVDEFLAGADAAMALLK